MATNNCFVGVNDRRRIFWATQPSACGSFFKCDGDDCGFPGIEIIKDGAEATISNSAYVRGLALNILYTNGVRDSSRCGGFMPGSRGGHWSDSFTGTSSGSSIIDIPVSYTVGQMVNLVKAFVTQAMRKLVTYGVATNVSVDATYGGNNSVDVTIIITGSSNNREMVTVSGQRQSNSWVWN